jgi:hypothetical protein
MTALPSAPTGYSLVKVKVGRVLHLAPTGFTASLCGLMAYPLRRPPHASEHICGNCQRELFRRRAEKRGGEALVPMLPPLGTERYRSNEH